MNQFKQHLEQIEAIIKQIKQQSSNMTVRSIIYDVELAVETALARVEKEMK